MGSYIDEAVKKIMDYHPIDGMYGAERIGDFIVKPHGNRVYSLSRVDSAAKILIRADSPHMAVIIVRRIFDKDD